MTTTIGLLISGVGLLLSVISAVVIVSVSFGSFRERIRELESKQSNTVTRDDLVPIKESLAEIRGMFRLELKDK